MGVTSLGVLGVPLIMVPDNNIYLLDEILVPHRTYSWCMCMRANNALGFQIKTYSKAIFEYRLNWGTGGPLAGLTRGDGQILGVSMFRGVFVLRTIHSINFSKHAESAKLRFGSVLCITDHSTLRGRSSASHFWMLWHFLYLFIVVGIFVQMV
jgi:hypothetical protein